jgi:hypothetical protein
MSIRHGTVLQIVPQLPGTFDGVGDYALNLAKSLLAGHGIDTIFAVGRETSVESKDGFRVVSGLHRNDRADLLAEHAADVFLHYVNYGYQARGVPLSLRAFARRLRRKVRGRWITTFHELYASGPPSTSAFWLRPLQVRIARDLVGISDSCIVSNTPIEQAIHAFDASKPVHLVPVMSNFGEPELSDFGAVSPKRWAICGGTALIARSLRLFEQLHQLIPDAFTPEHLDVVGGHEQPSIDAIFDRLRRNRPGLSCHYYPEVSAELASEVLRRSSFGWIDYFGAGKMWPNMVLKSTAFAAFCAHGIVSILSHRENPIAMEGDALPGPYYLTPGAIHFPPPERLREIQQQIYTWYHAHADSRQLARVYAEALT